jgi:hypothetical protein
MLLYSKTSGFGRILYGYEFTQQTYDLVSRWVFSY